MSTVTYAITRAEGSPLVSKVILSTDTGLTWFESPPLTIPPSGASWKDVCAFPLFSNLAILTNGTVIYYTTDGGLTWSQSGGTYVGVDTNPVLFAVSPLVAFSAGQNIARSLDSGATFDQLTTAATITGVPGSAATSIFFQSDTYGFVGIGNKVYATINGGLNWTVLNGGNDIVTGEPVRSIASDASVGIIVSTRWAIHKSVDGGNTFIQTLALPTTNTSAINYIKKVTPQNYYITLDNVSNPANSTVFKSINGGTTWVGQGNTPSQNQAADLVLYNNTTGLKLGKGNTIDRTANSFNTTTQVYTTKPVNKISADTYKCGECPDGYDYNSDTDKCEGTLTTIACPPGYNYNPITTKCVQIIAPFTSIDNNCGTCPVETIGDTEYCICVEEIDIFPCCYILTNCTDPEAAPIYTQTDLSEYDGQVITLVEYPGNCYVFEKIEGICEGQETVTVQNSYANCETCIPSYKVYNCQDPEIFYYTESDLSAYVTPSSTTNLVELPESCWQVGINYDFPYTPIPLTPVGPSYENCTDCRLIPYQLTNCTNPEIVILSSTNLSQYLGRVIQIDGYPGLCWTVTPMTCNCINVVITGALNYSGQLTTTGYLNDKLSYAFTISGIDYLIAWSLVDERWELSNVTTDTLLAYITMNTDCPFAANWRSADPPGNVNVELVESCYDNLYDVTVKEVFIDCECCLNNCK